jgi:hypothetical protein
MAKNGNNRPSFVAVLADDNSQLSCTQYDVYVALASYADSAFMAWPSHKAIQKRMRVPRDRRTVMRALRALEAMGKLEVLQGHGPKGTNVYIFTAARDRAESPTGERAPMHALRAGYGGRANGARGEGSHSAPSEVHIEVQEEKGSPNNSHSNCSEELVVASMRPSAREHYLSDVLWLQAERRARAQRAREWRERIEKGAA